MRFNDLNFAVRFIIYLISLFVGSYVIRQIGDSTANNLSGYKQGNRRRSVAIWRLLWIMAHLSVLVYMHLFSVFKSNHYTKEEKGRAYIKNLTPLNAKYQRRSLLVFWIVIIGAHLSYFLYTVDRVVPWLLFDFCNICTGIWLHLVFFSGLFLSIGFGLRYFKIGNMLVEQVFRLRPLKLFATDPRTQVSFTVFMTLFLCTLQFISSDKLTVKELTIQSKSKSLPTQRFVMLSDIHAGASVYASQVERVVEKVNSIDNQQRLDAVFLVGDVIDAPRGLIEDRVSSLQHLRPRTFMTTGNHETYYGNFAEWDDLFKSYRIKVLSNEIVDLNGTCIVGLNDISGYKSGIVNASMDPSVIQQCSNSSPIIVLAHNPAATPKILKAANTFDRHVDLILSGHTHAGQYYILTPFVYWVLPYLYGSYNVGDGSTNLLIMSILAAPRRKQRLSTDPQNVQWTNESSVGKRLMHQMGWSKGSGLGKNEQGQSENLKLKANLTGRGLGKDEHRSTEHWIAHQDNFETLLAQLNQKSTTKQSSVDLPNKEDVVQTTKNIRSRTLRARFCRAKDLSIICPASKAGIFGIKSEQSTVEVRESNVEEQETECKSNDDNLIVTSKSAAEIYKEKMQKWSYFGPNTNDNLKKRDANTNDQLEGRPEAKKKRRKFNS
ncbi:Transmembrane protein with metallophosphoesterase domain [Aphelenchoides besseyi]|nr:Transmembrane protein with metallophosphoesterase domain [Aphelenchoides besseyi]KAI6208095.1 Transmembrane protein with metallophosphoesterase domain [Aphelenchoides besseyi]